MPPGPGSRSTPRKASCVSNAGSRYVVHCLGLGQQIVDQLEGEVLGQLADMAGCVDTRGGRDRARETNGGRLAHARSSWGSGISTVLALQGLRRIPSPPLNRDTRPSTGV
jgi:hypothetical protein